MEADLTGFYTPRRNQGQIVLVSYRWNEMHLEMLVNDQSDRTLRVYVLNEDIAVQVPESWDPWGDRDLAEVVTIDDSEDWTLVYTIGPIV